MLNMGPALYMYLKLDMHVLHTPVWGFGDDRMDVYGVEKERTQDTKWARIKQRVCIYKIDHHSVRTDFRSDPGQQNEQNSR